MEKSTIHGSWKLLRSNLLKSLQVYRQNFQPVQNLKTVLQGCIINICLYGLMLMSDQTPANSCWATAGSNRTALYSLYSTVNRDERGKTDRKSYLASPQCNTPVTMVNLKRIRPGTTGFRLTSAKDNSVFKNTAEDFMMCCPKRNVAIVDHQFL